MKFMPHQPRRLLSQPHFLGLGLSLLLLIAVATASYSSWKAFEAAADETRNIRANINELKDLFILLQSAESGQRGFLLTGNAQYLEPYNKAVPEIRNRLGKLARPASTYSFHPALIAQLRAAILEKLTEMEATVALKRKGYAPAAQAVVTSNRGQVTMDEIRALERRLEQDQDASLNVTRENSRYFARVAQLISTLGSCGIFIIVLLSAAQIHRLMSTRDRLNSQLEQSVADFQHLADSVPQIVWRMTSDGTLEYVNRRWLDFSGLAPDLKAEDSWARLVHPHDRRKFLEHWKNARQAERPFTAECRMKDSATGRYRWLLFRAAPVREQSGRVRWFGTYTDISHQKAIEQALQRSNEDLQQFVYSASHDLQEPLRTLMIYSELIGKRSKTRLDEEDEGHLRLLRDSAQRMRALVIDLLTYTEILSSGSDRGKLADGSAVFHKAVANLESAIRESGAQIKCNGLPQLTISEPQLLQLFQNLISNALKYRKAGEAPEIEVSARQEDSNWVISVRDNGIGIDPVYHSRIFGIFKRLHTSHQYPGTGLGLAICKKIVERNQGRIWVESQPGLGSTFSFSLPADGAISSQSAKGTGTRPIQNDGTAVMPGH
jgi:PAS domain S-box-containing protein